MNKDNIITKLEKDIEKAKIKILKGRLCENLGENEQRQLEEKYNIYDYDFMTRQKIETLLNAFADWRTTRTYKDFIK